MSSNKIAFVNVSFKEKYIEVQARLKDSIKEFYPEAEMFFWSDEMPPNSKPFQQSLYGFKVHAIQHAIDKGFTKVIWLDSCAIIKKPIEPLLDIAKKRGIVAVLDNQKLFRYISDKFKSITGEINKDWNLVGGSLYIFDFENPVGKKIFEEWKELEAGGYFGTQELIMKEQNDGVDKCGHRMDETCMAYLLYKNERPPLTQDVINYNNGEESIILKNHFVKDGEKWYQKTRAIHEHTVDISLFTNGGICIDVGCRGFQFSEAMRDFGLEVKAFDIEDMTPPVDINFYKLGVSSKNGFGYVRKTDDPNATTVIEKGSIPIELIDINDLYDRWGDIDLLKLDCEGSEYMILSDPYFRPVPKQISIEFHKHSQPELHEKYYDKCMANLLKYYKPIKHKMTDEHCAGFNYWDSLFIRLDLL